MLCKHSGFTATAASHLKASVFGDVQWKCRSVKWLKLQRLLFPPRVTSLVFWEGEFGVVFIFVKEALFYAHAEGQTVILAVYHNRCM